MPVNVSTQSVNAGTQSVHAGARRSDETPDHPTVPWRTVLPLAFAMAYADGFWMVSLRGAVGAIERTQDPFASWLRESTAVLPVFVFAVLAAQTLALRWFGPSLRRSRTVVATALMIVAAGTAVGIATVAASSAYDYHLQSNQLRLMGLMGNTSPAATSLGQQASLHLLTRAVAYGSGIILVTNCVLVGLLVAMWGGRLRVISSRRRAPRLAPAPSDPTGRQQARRLLAAGLFGSAAIHAAVVPEHQTEWAAASGFFVVLVAAELVVAGLTLARPRTATLYVAAAVSIGPLVLWLCSRTVGLPFGPEAGTPERIGLADVAACALELGTLLVAVVLLRAEGWFLRRRPWSAHVGWLALVAVLAVTGLGLAGSGLVRLEGSGQPSSTTSAH